MTVMHLRNISHVSSSRSAKVICLNRHVTIIGRNAAQVDYMICSDNREQNNFISRIHARIVRCENRHRIHDDSRNGVYVNNVKIAGSVLLEEGDCIIFGHPIGENLKTGTRIRQPDSEYQYIFEACTCVLENYIVDQSSQLAVEFKKPSLPSITTGDSRSYNLYSSTKQEAKCSNYKIFVVNASDRDQKHTIERIEEESASNIIASTPSDITCNDDEPDQLINLSEPAADGWRNHVVVDANMLGIAVEDQSDHEVVRETVPGAIVYNTRSEVKVVGGCTSRDVAVGVSSDQVDGVTSTHMTVEILHDDNTLIRMIRMPSMAPTDQIDQVMSAVLPDEQTHKCVNGIRKICEADEEISIYEEYQGCECLNYDLEKTSPSGDVGERESCSAPDVVAACESHSSLSENVPINCVVVETESQVGESEGSGEILIHNGDHDILSICDSSSADTKLVVSSNGQTCGGDHLDQSLKCLEKSVIFDEQSQSYCDDVLSAEVRDEQSKGSDNGSVSCSIGHAISTDEQLIESRSVSGQLFHTSIIDESVGPNASEVLSRDEQNQRSCYNNVVGPNFQLQHQDCNINEYESCNVQEILELHNQFVVRHDEENENCTTESGDCRNKPYNRSVENVGQNSDKQNLVLQNELPQVGVCSEFSAIFSEKIVSFCGKRQDVEAIIVENCGIEQLASHAGQIEGINNMEIVDCNSGNLYLSLPFEQHQGSNEEEISIDQARGVASCNDRHQGKTTDDIVDNGELISGYAVDVVSPSECVGVVFPDDHGSLNVKIDMCCAIDVCSAGEQHKNVNHAKIVSCSTGDLSFLRENNEVSGDSARVNLNDGEVVSPDKQNQNDGNMVGFSCIAKDVTSHEHYYADASCVSDSSCNIKGLFSPNEQHRGIVDEALASFTVGDVVPPDKLLSGMSDIDAIFASNEEVSLHEDHQASNTEETGSSDNLELVSSDGKNLSGNKCGHVNLNTGYLTSHRDNDEKISGNLVSFHDYDEEATGEFVTHSNNDKKLIEGVISHSDDDEEISSCKAENVVSPHKEQATIDDDNVNCNINDVLFDEQFECNEVRAVARFNVANPVSRDENYAESCVETASNVVADAFPPNKQYDSCITFEIKEYDAKNFVSQHEHDRNSNVCEFSKSNVNENLPYEQHHGSNEEEISNAHAGGVASWNDHHQEKTNDDIVSCNEGISHYDAVDMISCQERHQENSSRDIVSCYIDEEVLSYQQHESSDIKDIIMCNPDKFPPYILSPENKEYGGVSCNLLKRTNSPEGKYEEIVHPNDNVEAIVSSNEQGSKCVALASLLDEYSVSADTSLLESSIVDTGCGSHENKRSLSEYHQENEVGECVAGELGVVISPDGAYRDCLVGESESCQVGDLILSGENDEGSGFRKVANVIPPDKGHRSCDVGESGHCATVDEPSQKHDQVVAGKSVTCSPEEVASSHDLKGSEVGGNGINEVLDVIVLDLQNRDSSSIEVMESVASEKGFEIFPSEENQESPVRKSVTCEVGVMISRDEYHQESACSGRIACEAADMVSRDEIEMGKSEIEVTCDVGDMLPLNKDQDESCVKESLLNAVQVIYSPDNYYKEMVIDESVTYKVTGVVSLDEKRQEKYVDESLTCNLQNVVLSNQEDQVKDVTDLDSCDAEYETTSNELSQPNYSASIVNCNVRECILSDVELKDSCVCESVNDTISHQQRQQGCDQDTLISYVAGNHISSEDLEERSSSKVFGSDNIVEELVKPLETCLKKGDNNVVNECFENVILPEKHYQVFNGEKNESIANVNENGESCNDLNVALPNEQQQENVDVNRASHFTISVAQTDEQCQDSADDSGTSSYTTSLALPDEQHQENVDINSARRSTTSVAQTDEQRQENADESGLNAYTTSVALPDEQHQESRLGCGSVICVGDILHSKPNQESSSCRPTVGLSSSDIKKVDSSDLQQQQLKDNSTDTAVNCDTSSVVSLKHYGVCGLIDVASDLLHQSSNVVDPVDVEEGVVIPQITQLRDRGSYDHESSDVAVSKIIAAYNIAGDDEMKDTSEQDSTCALSIEQPRSAASSVLLAVAAESQDGQFDDVDSDEEIMFIASVKEKLPRINSCLSPKLGMDRFSSAPYSSPTAFAGRFLNSNQQSETGVLGKAFSKLASPASVCNTGLFAASDMFNSLTPDRSVPSRSQNARASIAENPSAATDHANIARTAVSGLGPADQNPISAGTIPADSRKRRRSSEDSFCSEKRLQADKSSPFLQCAIYNRVPSVEISLVTSADIPDTYASVNKVPANNESFEETSALCSTVATTVSYKITLCSSVAGDGIMDVSSKTIEPFEQKMDAEVVLPSENFDQCDHTMAVSDEVCHEILRETSCPVGDSNTWRVRDKTVLDAMVGDFSDHKVFIEPVLDTRIDDKSDHSVIVGDPEVLGDATLDTAAVTQCDQAVTVVDQSRSEALVMSALETRLGDQRDTTVKAGDHEVFGETALETTVGDQHDYAVTVSDLEVLSEATPDIAVGDQQGHVITVSYLSDGKVVDKTALGMSIEGLNNSMVIVDAKIDCKMPDTTHGYIAEFPLLDTSGHTVASEVIRGSVASIVASEEAVAAAVVESSTTSEKEESYVSIEYQIDCGLTDGATDDVDAGSLNLEVTDVAVTLNKMLTGSTDDSTTGVHLCVDEINELVFKEPNGLFNATDSVVIEAFTNSTNPGIVSEVMLPNDNVLLAPNECVEISVDAELIDASNVTYDTGSCIPSGNQKQISSNINENTKMSTDADSTDVNGFQLLADCLLLTSISESCCEARTDGRHLVDSINKLVTRNGREENVSDKEDQMSENIEVRTMNMREVDDELLKNSSSHDGSTSDGESVLYGLPNKAISGCEIVDIDIPEVVPTDKPTQKSYDEIVSGDGSGVALLDEHDQGNFDKRSYCNDCVAFSTGGENQVIQLCMEVDASGNVREVDSIIAQDQSFHPPSTNFVSSSVDDVSSELLCEQNSCIPSTQEDIFSESNEAHVSCVAHFNDELTGRAVVTNALENVAMERCVMAEEIGKSHLDGEVESFHLFLELSQDHSKHRRTSNQYKLDRELLELELQSTYPNNSQVPCEDEVAALSTSHAVHNDQGSECSSLVTNLNSSCSMEPSVHRSLSRDTGSPFSVSSQDASSQVTQMLSSPCSNRARESCACDATICISCEEDCINGRLCAEDGAHGACIESHELEIEIEPSEEISSKSSCSSMHFKADVDADALPVGCHKPVDESVDIDSAAEGHGLVSINYSVADTVSLSDNESYCDSEKRGSHSDSAHRYGSINSLCDTESIEGSSGECVSRSNIDDLFDEVTAECLIDVQSASVSACRELPSTVAADCPNRSVCDEPCSSMASKQIILATDLIPMHNLSSSAHFSVTDVEADELISRESVKTVTTDERNAIMRSSSPEFDEVPDHACSNILDRQGGAETYTDENVENDIYILQHEENSMKSSMDEVQHSSQPSGDITGVRHERELKIDFSTLCGNYKEHPFSGICEQEALCSNSEVVPDSEEDARSPVSVDIPIISSNRIRANMPRITELALGMDKLASLFQTTKNMNSNGSTSSPLVGSSAIVGTVSSKESVPAVGDSEVLFDDCDQDAFSPPPFDLSVIDSPTSRKSKSDMKRVEDYSTYESVAQTLHCTAIEEAATASDSSMLTEVNKQTPSCAIASGKVAGKSMIGESSASRCSTPRSLNRLSRKRSCAVDQDTSDITKRFCGPESLDSDMSPSQDFRQSSSLCRSERISCVLQKIKAKRSMKAEVDESRHSPDVVASLDSEVSQGMNCHTETPADNFEASLAKFMYMTQCLRRILNNNVQLNLQRIDSWRDELNTIENEAKLPSTVIAVVGDTGSGKSSLLNALFDSAGLLPTSGVRACTAVVVRVSENTSSDVYEADVEFLKEQEWMSELKLLLKELTIRKTGLVQTKQPDPDSEASVAWNKIRAVYGSFNKHVTLEQLTKQRSVTKWLGKQQHIVLRSPTDFKKAVSRYIESSDMGSGGDYWPIVKHVAIRLPRCDACSSGAVLVDLPGIGDSNAARDSIAKNYLKNCNAVWVVSSIHRAVNDKTARDLLGEHFRRQLLMDGQYGSVSFICSKTDILSPSEIVSNLKLDAQCEGVQSDISTYETSVDEVRAASVANDRVISKLKKQLSSIQQEELQLSSDFCELSQVLQEEGYADDEVHCELTQLQETLTDKSQMCTDLKMQLDWAKNQNAEYDRQANELVAKIATCRKSLMEICSLARNNYATHQIRRDFCAGMKQMRRLANTTTDDDDDEDEDEDDGVMDQVQKTAEKLKIFCCSSTEFLKLRGKMSKDGPSQVFNHIEDTGIPGLVDFVHSITRTRRRAAIQKMISNLGRFVVGVTGYLIDMGTQDEAVAFSSQQLFHRHLNVLSETTMPALVTEIVGSVRRMFGNCLEPKITEGSNQATSAADASVQKWGSKVNTQNRQLGGLPWSTYRATASRAGCFKSPSHGLVDFNADLSGPMYTAMSVVWDRVFNIQIAAALDTFKDKALGLLRSFYGNLHSELLKVPLSRDTLSRVAQQLMASATSRLLHYTDLLKAMIVERQRDISRLVTPTVQDQMSLAYNKCCMESGSGMFERMKSHMSKHVDKIKLPMFNKASETVITQLVALEEEIANGLKNACETLIIDIITLYEPLWETPTNDSPQRNDIIQEIKLLKEKVFDLYASAELNVDVAELNTLNKLLSTTGTSVTTPVLNCRREIMVLNRNKMPLLSTDKENKYSAVMSTTVATCSIPNTGSMLSAPVTCRVSNSVMTPVASASGIRTDTGPPKSVLFSGAMYSHSLSSSDNVASPVDPPRFKCSPRDGSKECSASSPKRNSTGSLVRLLPLSTMCSSKSLHAVDDDYRSQNIKVENVKLEPTSPISKKRPKFGIDVIDLTGDDDD